MLHGRGLVVEQDRKFTGTLQDDEEQVLPLSFASTLKQAQLLLRTDGAQITIAFVSTSVPPANGLDVVREIRALRPNLPIIIIDHYDFPRVTEEQVNALGCLALVLKPKTTADLLRPLIQRLESQNSWNDVAPSTEAKDITLDLTETEYLATPLRDFLLTPKSFFNIFIRLSAGKFVKVLNAGDTIDSTFAQKYIEKGVEYLYIKEEEQQRYINLCDKMVGDALKKSSSDVKNKAAKVLHLGENVKQGLYQSGLTAERMHFADNFLEHSADLARFIRRDDEKVAGLIESLLGRDHVAVVVMLSGLLAQNLGFESKKAVKMVGMAALFHDIGLYDLMPYLKTENTSKMSPDELLLWEKHPERGEEILREMGGFEEIVYQAVTQHHLRKRGDISRHKASQINMVSEIIGVVDDFQNYVLEKENSPESLTFFMKEKLPLFSPAIAEGFQKILKPSK